MTKLIKSLKKEKYELECKTENLKLLLEEFGHQASVELFSIMKLQIKYMNYYKNCLELQIQEIEENDNCELCEENPSESSEEVEKDEEDSNEENGMSKDLKESLEKLLSILPKKAELKVFEFNSKTGETKEVPIEKK